MVLAPILRSIFVQDGTLDHKLPDGISRQRHVIGKTDRTQNLQAQKFIAAYSAFLKRQGKLQIPGSSISTQQLVLNHGSG